MTKDEIIESAKTDRDNGMTYKAIAEKYNVSVSAVKSWASRKWNKIATKPKKVATKKKVASQVASPINDNDEYGLTTMQRRFADEYLVSGNATQACINAGYSKKTANRQGSRLLTNVDVKRYINGRLATESQKKIATANEIMELYTAIMRGEVKETVIVGTPMGVKATEKEADIKTRIAASKELMKRYPGNDEMIKTQLRKLEAEADIAERKAQLLDDSSQDGITINIQPFTEDI